MLKSLILAEKKRQKKIMLIKIIGLLLTAIVIYLAYNFIQNDWGNNWRVQLTSIFTEKDRSTRKFYQTFDAPEIGKKATLFRLKDIKNGKIFDLGQPRAKWVLIVFEAVGCPQCLAIEKDLTAVSRQNPNLEIITINIQNDQGKINDYLNTYNINRPWLYDEKALVSTAYRVDTLPAWFLIDQNNVIKLMNIETIDPSQIHALFKN
jgi:peroxiredoxin